MLGSSIFSFSPQCFQDFLSRSLKVRLSGKEVTLQGPKNFRIPTRPPAILHSSYSYTKKENPLALTKFFLERTSGLFGLCPSYYKMTKFERVVLNIVGKGENVYQQFFLLPQCFPSYQSQILSFQPHLNYSNAFNLDKSKLCC